MIKEIYQTDFFGRAMTEEERQELFLGTFEVLQQIIEGAFDEQFIGKKLETGAICLVNAKENYAGTGYTVTELLPEVLGELNHLNKSANAKL